MWTGVRPVPAQMWLWREFAIVERLRRVDHEQLLPDPLKRHLRQGGAPSKCGSAQEWASPSSPGADVGRGGPRHLHALALLPAHEAVVDVDGVDTVGTCEATSAACTYIHACVHACVLAWAFARAHLRACESKGRAARSRHARRNDSSLRPVGSAVSPGADVGASPRAAFSSAVQTDESTPPLTSENTCAAVPPRRAAAGMQRATCNMQHALTEDHVSQG